jgi:hypothetical protein
MPVFGLVNTKIILPTAPTRPISINGGGAMPGWAVRLSITFYCEVSISMYIFL